MLLLWKHLVGVFVAARHADGWLDACVRFIGAARAVFTYRKHRELLALEIVDKYVSDDGQGDALFHISHRHYLSTELSFRERIDCALTHYRYEGQSYTAAYKEAVYHHQGLTLWSRRVDSRRYALVLRATTDLRHEGGISVVLLADGHCLNEMSFAWVPGELLGLDRDVVPFITRNQSAHHDTAPVVQFRQDFPQNSPSYFCLAAMHGIAEANGKPHLAGIRHDCQIAFDERYASSFRSSYCDFWKSFGGVEQCRQAYLMPVPLVPPPLSSVKAKHRGRAIERRRHWSEISSGAAAIAALYVRDRKNRNAGAGAHVLHHLMPHLSTLMSLAMVF
ncbi:DUF535 family protein [Piscinibacter sp. XHJ-5]|uniref:DUF535 family protein n=1 Tax=Piscinibacter sp. XHJ-5 TaxID=3037797 RepID=UPI0024535F16|nr:DUF535 family protein [Piscinibacter sp. XHJ-5]